ncbi:MAG: signal peptidase I [Actinomycetota bacterium]|nr:signal peptidase I [Actinomycetota bacterium]
MAMPRFIPTLPSDRKHLPLVVGLIVMLTALVSVLYITHDFAKVDGDSMNPSLLNGDRMLITKGYPSPARGDIISFHATFSGKPDQLVKRVVAVAGDTVEVFGDRVLVNGVEPTIDSKILIGKEQFHLGPFTIQPGTVYVLGDNRPVSLDSRYIGAVPLTEIRGKVVWIFAPITRFRHIDAKG